MTYSEKLRDPRWQKKRLEILERDEFTCQECKSTDKELHVHHKYYLKDCEPWDYSNKALITLCVDCHEYEEQCKDSVNKFINALKDSGFKNRHFEELSYFASRIENYKDIFSVMRNIMRFNSFLHDILPLSKRYSKFGHFYKKIDELLKEIDEDDLWSFYFFNNADKIKEFLTIKDKEDGQF